jgi:hypothetical protein
MSNVRSRFAHGLVDVWQDVALDAANIGVDMSVIPLISFDIVSARYHR